MILVSNVALPLDTDFDNLTRAAANALRLPQNRVLTAKLYRRSVDARKKYDVHFCCSLLVTLDSGEEQAVNSCPSAQLYVPKTYTWMTAKPSSCRPVVVGFGPAGMFAALALAKAGLKPIVLERGSDADSRTQKVQDFFAGKALDPECNVQFGEGGAGTFSDGKLNTGIKNPRCRTVLETFYAHGAPEKILTDAKPHIGTDILVTVVKSIRREILSLGGTVLFQTKLEKITAVGGKITSVKASGKDISTDCVLLATGHSARDTYRMLLDSGVTMEKKPFAMGVRIEHLQSDINKALYGKFADSPFLGAADYKLAAHLKSGRGVFTFCMCPGGEVINASSNEGGLAVNGMSNSRRDGKNANSALLVGVEPADFPGESVLSGCEMQEKIEKAAYRSAKGAVPVNTVGNFVFGEPFSLTKVRPTVKPGYAYSDFKDIFPGWMLDSLKEGIREFAKKINGFDEKAAVLTAPETRSSSPVRLLRDESGQSVSVRGLYPCGEGAGYAGGIVSAAVDGIVAAEKAMQSVEF